VSSPPADPRGGERNRADERTSVTRRLYGAVGRCLDCPYESRPKAWAGQAEQCAVEHWRAKHGASGG
jgi:hypothetical protein